jgi:very-short-patch-repair endonuclease
VSGGSPENRRRAIELRKALTPTEARLWGALKQLRSRGHHFRRQAPFRGYVLDFVCFSRKLVIEVDGPSHEAVEQADHDVVRDAVLAREGFRTLRFWNHEIHDLEAVVAQILAALADTPPPGPLRGRPSP